MTCSSIKPATVHCFFACGHSVACATPELAHASMEAHYADRHAAEIRRILAP
ncbi:MAG: hypothetical protein WKF96_00200 [Solirubrobacteraceae bacterium]